MTKTNNSGRLTTAGDGKKGSSSRIVAAGLAMLIVLLAGTARNLTARQRPGTRSADLKVSVRVYNYAGISANMLKLAESEANRIFVKAGVHLQWLECPITATVEPADSICAAPGTPLNLQLRILKRVRLTRIHDDAEIAGYTVGNLATVQLEPLRELLTSSKCVLSLMLGQAIAHELGHALLGAPHSPQGIMQGSWGKDQVEFTAANDRVFTPDQAMALRWEVKTRSGQ